jgi:heme/copper-type cytochrome/quinol oxidase subunit 2
MMRRGECSMKTIKRGLNIALLAVSGMALLAGKANAQINMQEKEHIQNIVWVFEFVTFVTAMAVVWFVWRISKRDYKNKRSKQDDS